MNIGAVRAAHRRRSRPAATLLGAALLFVACGQTVPSPSPPPSPVGSAASFASASPGAFGASPPPVASVEPSATAVPSRLPGEPDPRRTPGAFNPAVTQATIGRTICVPGWTATVRPPEAYTEGLKRAGISAYGYADRRLSSYEEDHLIPLELGGAPRDPKNLWPEPKTASLPDGTPLGASVKDEFENRLHADVCDGTMTLAQARTEVGIHWAHYWLGLPVP